MADKESASSAATSSSTDPRACRGVYAGEPRPTRCRYDGARGHRDHQPPAGKQHFIAAGLEGGRLGATAAVRASFEGRPLGSTVSTWRRSKTSPSCQGVGWGRRRPSARHLRGDPWAQRCRRGGARGRRHHQPPGKLHLSPVMNKPPPPNRHDSAPLTPSGDQPPALTARALQ